MRRCAAASLPWSRWFIDTAWGERLFDLDLLDVAAEPGIRLRWAELYRVLREPVAAVTQRGLLLEALEEDAAGRLAPVLRDTGRAGCTGRAASTCWSPATAAIPGCGRSPPAPRCRASTAWR